ncbi:MAG: tRNA lysidine(34) synthetase TilS [Lachnospiraceae bacterium]|nr:tRNA lysidine(34) synthetase TilS [Lachnospiraceae bacterium]
MIGKVLQYVKEYRMIEEGDCIVAGVSGGADSVCLLLMLLEIEKTIPIEIKVVHINHLIRPDAAKDAAYVRQLCVKYGLSFTLVEEDVAALACKSHVSTEEAGRQVRYEAFERVLGAQRGKIAVAHNKNDSCETVLFHLFRGTSIRGLTGIHPVRGQIIRPLLCLSRHEIELFLQERTMSYCIDSTNLEDTYSRNVIRHHILDTAVREISPAAVAHISSASERMREAYELIADMTEQGIRTCVRERQGVFSIDKQKFLRLHKTVQGYVVMEVLAQAGGSRKDLETVHIRQVQRLLDSQCSREICLPHGLRARRDYTGISIYKEETGQRQETALPECTVSEEDRTRLEAGEGLEFLLGNNQKLRAAVLSLEKNALDFKNIPENKYTKWIDYDKIRDSIVIRTRKPGDYLTVNNMNQKKTLKAYLIDRKIPQSERERLFLVADANHVIWLVGERISNYYKVSEHTKRILCLDFEQMRV